MQAAHVGPLKRHLVVDLVRRAGIPRSRGSIRVDRLNLAPVHPCGASASQPQRVIALRLRSPRRSLSPQDLGVVLHDGRMIERSSRPLTTRGPYLAQRRQTRGLRTRRSVDALKVRVARVALNQRPASVVRSERDLHRGQALTLDVAALACGQLLDLGRRQPDWGGIAHAVSAQGFKGSYPMAGAGDASPLEPSAPCGRRESRAPSAC
jgi:hypothetical protein